jgi:hypothetical protein
LKTTKKILNAFNLVLFVGSLCFASLNGFFSTQSPVSPDHILHQFVSKKSVEDGGCSQLMFEKNENETEDGFQAQSFSLPFFVSYFQFEVSEPDHFFVQPVTKADINPIYLAVCNFRV